jgi:hypothetical protein
MLRIFTIKVNGSDSFTTHYGKCIIFKYRVDGVADRNKIKKHGKPTNISYNMFSIPHSLGSCRHILPIFPPSSNEKSINFKII